MEEHREDSVMRTYILPESGVDFKANLHCHTVISDGEKTPEEIKAMYKARGYSAVAYTDHDILIDHSDLTDEGFVALNGYELHVPPLYPSTCHMCFIAKDPKNLTMVCHAPGYLNWGNMPKYADQIQFDRDDFVREYSHKGVSEMFRIGRENGFFVTYNHPVWSQERYPEYSGYEGMNALEIFNTGCFRNGYPEYNAGVYDDLLRQGKRIFCIAADDNHNHSEAAHWHPDIDSFGGWVMIRAERLGYENLIRALENGDFYASCRPEIKSCYIEDGVAHITTSAVCRIAMVTARRNAAAVEVTGDDRVCEAHFPISPEDGYIRFDVVDENGNHANTNAKFLDTL